MLPCLMLCCCVSVFVVHAVCFARCASSRVSCLPGVLRVCLCFPSGSDLESDVFMCLGSVRVVVGVGVCVCAFGTLHVC